MTAKELRHRGTCIRPGCKVMKLDKSKTEGKVRFPWQRTKKKQREEAKQQYAALTRVGRVSMVQIGEDEFRTPTRGERRAAKIRPAMAQRNVLVSIANKRGVAALRSPVIVPGSPPLLPRTYTRKAKLARKTVFTFELRGYAAMTGGHG